MLRRRPRASFSTETSSTWSALSMIRSDKAKPTPKSSSSVGEAIITAVMGAILGVAVGVLFGVLISRPLAGEGFVLAVPYLTLVILLLLGALSGTLAAIGPARRASRIDVLDALTH